MRLINKRIHSVIGKILRAEAVIYIYIYKQTEIQLCIDK